MLVFRIDFVLEGKLPDTIQRAATINCRDTGRLRIDCDAELPSLTDDGLITACFSQFAS